MIIVCSLAEAQKQIDTHGAKQAITILDPDTPMQPFRGLAPGRHLRLDFHDITEEEPGLLHPEEKDARRLLDFIRSWDRNSPLLIHCWAGISRSTATAFSALCVLRPNAPERDLARELREASPTATPNRLIITHMDRMLGRDGRMLQAVADIGRGAPAFEGTPFILRP
jgi:predicted protein tyrosine phosphatase